MAKTPAKATPTKPVKKADEPAVKVKVIGPNNSKGNATLSKTIKGGLPNGPRVPTPPAPTPGGNDMKAGAIKKKK